MQSKIFHPGAVISRLDVYFKLGISPTNWNLLHLCKTSTVDPSEVPIAQKFKRVVVVGEGEEEVRPKAEATCGQ